LRKIIVQEFITLDGVMQAPGGPEEDKSSGFKYGGWTAPYFYEADEEAGKFMEKNMKSTDLLLGTVDEIDEMLARLRKCGTQLVGEVVQYEDLYRLCYIRGPEGLLIGLAEQLGNK
jgi:predicted enzyme related to lactoylglutathione lyase